MASIHTILGYVTLMMVAVAMILGLTILVLIEARWILRLFVELSSGLKASAHQLHDDDEANQDHGSEQRHGG